MNVRSKPLVFVTEDDRTGLGLHYARHLFSADSENECTVVDVNSCLDVYTEALKDIVDGDELRTLVKQQRHDQLEQMIEREHEELASHCNVKVLEGVPFIETIKESLRNENALIIKMAQSDISPKERLFGSTDMHLMRKSSVPVMILNPKQTELPKKILVPIDVSHDLDKEEFNHSIVDMAGFVAQQFDSEIHLLAVWRLEGEEIIRSSSLLNIGEERIQKMMERIENKAKSSLQTLANHLKTTFALNYEPSVHLSKGNANIVIPKFVKDHQIEMIVMGTVGRASIPGLFIGNTAEVVLSTVNCSVLTTKPAGFVTPVAI